MSTKTTFKRIALVAVAAMGFGMLSVAPSSAAHVFSADTLTLSSATSTVAVGSSVSITATVGFIAGGSIETMTVTSSFTSAPSGAVVSELPTPTFSSGSNSYAQFNGKVINAGAQAINIGTQNVSTVTFSPLQVGTYVIKFLPEAATTSDAINATAQTWTVTVTALATAAAADSTSTSVLRSGNLVSGSAQSVSAAMAVAAGVPAATILVTPLVGGLATTGSTVITASVSGPGTVGIGTSAPATSTGRSLTSGFSPGAIVVSVYADGTSGSSVVTITLGSVVLGTKTVTFYGAAATITSTLVIPVINSGSGAVAQSAVTALVKDANGIAVPGAKVWFASGTPAVFASTGATAVSAGSTGIATFSVLGLTAGTSTVTAQNVAVGSTATISAAAVSVRAGSNVASTVTMTLDKATYVPGEAVTLTVVIKDAAGSTVADGDHVVFATGGVTSSRALTVSTLPSGTTLTAGSSTGTLTYKLNAPLSSGDFVISAVGDTDLAASQSGLAISVTGTVGLSADATAAADAVAAAADAAAEATDAANAATDAANAAAEAADAATAAAQDAADAVAALSVQVGELVAGLTAQITAQKAAIRALTNLVIKIQKKIKA